MARIPYNPFQYTHPQLKRELLEAFEQFYNSQQYILGPELSKFERSYAQYNEVNHAIGVGNGHDALLIILKCLGIGDGDEVILPAHTFAATALSVSNAGAVPVPADISEQTLTIDPWEIETKVTPKTRAVVPVHLYGNPADLRTILEVISKYNLYLVEDNAQAQGALVNGKKTGSIGVMGFSSFYPTKNIGALGDGGIITTDAPHLADEARALRNYGKTAQGRFAMEGVNSRLDEWQAKVLSIKLKYLDGWNEERQQIAEWYEERLKSVEQISMQVNQPDAVNVRHIFPVFTSRREKLRNYLKEHGIDTLIHYEKPIHLHEAFKGIGYKLGDFPVAERSCQEELSLPIYPGLREKEVLYICDRIEAFFKTH
jgi:dTDP-4-amino-4,6-dideoxygalactose transaminase